MGRWKIFTTAGIAASIDDGCSVCDHPFGHLAHACISSIGPTAAPVSLPVRLPEAVVA
ncbi:hypothetical protein [Mycolicibacterium sp.]|uniref:hypothetical protein n=1 Tax=Mycolicibacterium sp. TaxID=2320850 RepID=UPI001A1C8BB4|nr:hypothetical protein [Mycolicibacterium sp.]MBJ7339309.1 hypothetical protein [Mycolicibacterium sp.]